LVAATGFDQHKLVAALDRLLRYQNCARAFNPDRRLRQVEDFVVCALSQRVRAVVVGLDVRRLRARGQAHCAIVNASADIQETGQGLFFVRSSLPPHARIVDQKGPDVPAMRQALFSARIAPPKYCLAVMGS
jgi:hypothetical protein